MCYHICTSCRPSRLESVAWFTFVFLLLTPVSVCVCVRALNCGGSPSPEPHHNWRFGAFLICNFCMHFVKLELVVFLGIFVGTLSRVGGIELFAHCSPLAAVCVGNPFTGIALKIEVLVRHYGSSLQYAMAMSWFTSIEISTLKFGMWSSAPVATVGWQFSFNPLCGIGCDLLSTALCKGPSTGFCTIMGDGVMWSGSQEFWNKFFVSLLNCSDSAALGASTLPPNWLRTKFSLVWILCAHLLEWLPHLAFSWSELVRLRSLKYLRFTISVYCIFVNLKPKSPWLVATPFQAIWVVWCHR